jgi:hypothetical protein
MDQPTDREEHGHPVFRMRDYASLSTIHPRSDLDDDRADYTPHDPDDVARIQPILAALGAGFDYCAPCVRRHTTAIARDPLLLVWLAFGVGVQAGRWMTLPQGKDLERWRYLEARLDPDAATVVDALYAGGDDGLGAALAAATALPEQRRAVAAKVMVDLLFVALDTMNMPVGWGEIGLLNTGAPVGDDDRVGAPSGTSSAEGEN